MVAHPDRRTASTLPLPLATPDPASDTLPGHHWAIRFVRRDSCAWRLVRVAGDWEPENLKPASLGGSEMLQS